MEEHEKQKLRDQINKLGRAEMWQRLKRGDFNGIRSHRAFVETELEELDRADQEKSNTSTKRLAVAAIWLAVIAILISLFLPNGLKFG